MGEKGEQVADTANLCKRSFYGSARRCRWGSMYTARPSDCKTWLARRSTVWRQFASVSGAQSANAAISSCGEAAPAWRM